MRERLAYLSVCSGIEAASVAWQPLGWKPWAFSEIEAFPCSVLAHHYPTVPNLGDMTRFKEWPDANLDLLCGGTPCQSFSNAGLRAGLDDPRGQLMLTFGAIAARYRPRWLVWENVPGVLSSNDGRDFGSFLGLLGFLGYGFAYRVLDAQYVRVDGYGRAVPQRRNRVFVVGCLGDWRSAAAVLFERESLRGDPAPSRRAEQDVAPTVAGGARKRGGYSADDTPAVGVDYTNCLIQGDISGTIEAAQRKSNRGQGILAYGGNNTAGPIDVSTALSASASASGRMDFASETFLAFDTTQITSAANGSNPKAGDPCHPLAAGAHPPAIAFDCKASGQAGFGVGPVASTMRAICHTGSHQNGGGHQAICFQERGRDDGRSLEVGGDVAYAMTAPAGGGRTQERNVLDAVMRVRRLMPVECERLQGFPDNWTLIPWRGKPAEQCPDGPRYRAIGNSWAVNCPRWIGRRIAIVDSLSMKAAA